MKTPLLAVAFATSGLLAAASPTLDIFIHEGEGQGQNPSTQQACWRACFYEEPKCPEGLYAKKFGDCWTCCWGDEDLKVKQIKAPPKKQEIAREDDQTAINLNQGICWLFCASNEIQCPEGWYSQQMGNCWTCCRDGEGLNLNAQSPAPAHNCRGGGDVQAKSFKTEMKK